ncbi:MAG: ABC transporter permease [Alistipes sp.]|nr:ABC transporter permease [Alistipes sp.]
MFDLDRWEEIWQTITRNRKRSIMTAFGVFWGIFMLTIMAGAGLALKRMMLSNFGDMAVNSCFYFGGVTSLPYDGLPSGRSWQYENPDLQAIRRQIPGVEHVAGIIWGSSYKFIRNDKKGDFRTIGYAPDFQQISPQLLPYGRFINDIDMEQQRKVAVIGEEVWTELFQRDENPVGQTIRMNNIYLTVIGVFRAQNGVRFHDERTVIIPFSTLQQMYQKGTRFDALAISAYDGVDINRVEEQLKQYTRAAHRISPHDTKAINGFNLGEHFNKFNSLFNGISLLTWIVGIGTLLAGIVGVSNIMLVVVRERTQEIGVRRALGAKPRIIISQIMSESFVLTFVAGVGGLALAVALLSGAETLFSAQRIAAGESPIHAQISFGMAMASLFVLIIGSLLAGILPAYRALRIKPVDAIREE